jgi:SSS family solute:Na+ symporter
MLTVFFFARLWRRAGILTDVAFAELRYGGRPAGSCAASVRSISRFRSTAQHPSSMGILLESGAGIGLVLILRWYGWRVNAWSEIAAMAAPAIGFVYLKGFTAVAFPYTLLYLVGWTTVWWVVVTFLTRPESEEHLIAFYRRVRPGGPGWTRVAKAAGEPPPEPIAGLAIEWVAGSLLIYSTLFGIGTLLLDSWTRSLIWFAAAAAAVVVIYVSLSRRGWKTVTA